VARPIASRLRLLSSVGSVGAAFVLAACQRATPVDRSGTSVDLDGAAASAAPVPEAAPPPLPPDIDVRALERQLSCPRRHARACRILREFAQASKGIGQAPSGQGRFMGTAYRVDRGVEKAELVLLAASNAPANMVGPTDIPLKVAMGSLPKDKHRDGIKLARALAHGSVPSSSNKALAFAKTWSSENGRIAMATEGPSVRLIAEEATYVRQAGQKALVIKMKPALPGVVVPPGDGTYAELWAVTW
jgi:hypothetical protein